MSENMPSCFAVRCIWDQCTEIRKGHLNTYTQYQIYKHNLLIEEGCFMSMIYRSKNICINVVLFFFFFFSQLGTNSVFLNGTLKESMLELKGGINSMCGCW